MLMLDSLRAKLKNSQSSELFISLISLIFFLIFIFLVGSQDKAQPEPDQDSQINTESTLSSSEVFPEILEKAADWSADFKVLGCSGITINSLEINGEKLTFIGAEDGRFASWSCNIFSANKKQSRTILWNKGELVFSDPITLEDNVASLIENRSSFNELDSVVSSSEIFEKALEKGLNTETNFYNFYIGEAVTNKFPKSYVWQIEERSKTEKDSNGVSKLIQNYFYDAKTGEFLRIESI
jgi:hypothetical protein